MEAEKSKETEELIDKQQSNLESGAVSKGNGRQDSACNTEAEGDPGGDSNPGNTRRGINPVKPEADGGEGDPGGDSNPGNTRRGGNH